MTAPLALPHRPAPRLLVIVVAYQAALLRNCLRTLAADLPPGVAVEVIAVLNALPAGERAALARELPSVELVATAVNRGLAGAANLGRAHARGELLLLLHDDVELESGCVAALLAAADAHPRAGAIGPQVLDMVGTLQSAGGVLWADGTTSPPWLGEHAPPPTAFDRPRAVDYLGTAALLVRAASWDAVGGLDERYYPVYYVDVDLAVALRARGEVVRYEPRARIRHHRGASGSIAWRLFLSARNRALLVARWGPELRRQEPAEVSAEAIARALARAEARGAELESAPPPPTRPPSRPPTTPASDVDYRRRELALIAELARSLRRRDRWREVLPLCRRAAGRGRWSRLTALARAARLLLARG